MIPRAIIAWYVKHVYGVVEGPGIAPFYCDSGKVGRFAISAGDLAAGGDEALFRMFVCLSMFQGIRDVVVMNRQQALKKAAVACIADLGTIRLRIQRNDCKALSSQTTFKDACSISMQDRQVDCLNHPGRACHVKEATVSFQRMGDMGKLPTSAWLNVWQRRGGIRSLLEEAGRAEDTPTGRARYLVERFSQVHRVGTKLATMFVSALSTPALAPGLCPWFPFVDGNELTVVDTNVATAVDVLSRGNSRRTQEKRRRWLVTQSARIDLRTFHPAFPEYSPRIVQQALYWYGSKSNRRAHLLQCGNAMLNCEHCVPKLCPLVRQGASA